MRTSVTHELLTEIKKQYLLPRHGTHGIVHWHRVFENGMKLSQQDGINVRVVQLFSVFHDSCRHNEHRDPGHGKRGAALAAKLRKLCPLDDVEFDLLTIACKLHTSTQDHENRTVQACFDSDRLDLGRVGTYPDPDRLCTPMAKEEEVIEWAYQRSLHENELPGFAFGLSR